jgi:hypothetical protein
MKTILAILFALLSTHTFAQKTHTVIISDDLEGKINLQNPDEVFSPGVITIHKKSTGKELIKVQSDELALTLHDGKAVANIMQIPYGEQSLIIYEDFNFDGVKDLAIEDGQESCYHGPSFNIYLADKNDKNKFTHSAEFSRLSHEYCGMFFADSSLKKISVMTKSGYGWHQYSEFIVQNNVPFAVSIVTEDRFAQPFSITTTEKWNGKKMVKTVERFFDAETNGNNVEFSFEIEKNKKQVLLFTMNGDNLAYALIGQDKRVEFLYPESLNGKPPGFAFTITSKQHVLSFANKNAKYIVYEEKDGENVGVAVKVDGKTYDLTGIPKSKSGTLDFLTNSKFENVTIKQ